MCGISGIISNHPVSGEQISAMERMLASQRHRGPDHQACDTFDNQVVLGHNRLSIIDLSDQANQPMCSRDGRYSLIFNGEIYNYLELRSELKRDYTFNTASDTEVLLYAFDRWGVECLEKLNGMFAFAVYDAVKKQLTLARDRFGVKPVYYAHDKETGNLVFASEIKALHAYGIRKAPNERVWANYLNFGQYHYESQTFWNGIFSLPAGHMAQLDTQAPPFRITPVRWYRFASRVKTLQNNHDFKNRNTEAHKEKYKALLEDSISLRFRSDVPVGFNLSGGVDSSTLLGAVNHLYENTAIEAFSFYTNDERYDELLWVQRVIDKTNKLLNKVLLTSPEVPALSKELAFFQDEPYGGIPTIAYSQIFKQAREKGILVLLDGQGMDEAWAGYDYYHTPSDSVVQGVSSSPFRTGVLNPDFLKLAHKETYDTPFEEDMLNKQYRDLFYTKIPRALRFNDRVSMMHSTELREPFLDYRLVEYAFAQPMENKIQGTQTKWILRQIANDYLQDELTLAPKRALQTPQREWLTEDLLGWVESNINKMAESPWVNKKSLLNEWSAFLQSEKDNTFFVWQWISLAQLLSAADH